METDLIIFDQIDLVKVFAEGDVDPMLEGMAEKAKDFTPDTSTLKGRKEIASRAAKVSSARAAFDKARKQSIADHMIVIDKVNAAGKKIQDFTANLRDEVRQTLTDWEVEDKKRLAELAKQEEISQAWEEAIEKNDLIDREREIARKEAEFAKQEAERLAKEEADRIEEGRIAREEQIKKEAEEQAKKEAEKKVKDAEKKRIEAEFKAKEEKRKTKEAEKRAEQERIDAEKAAEQAEINRIAAEKKAEEGRIIAEKKAEQDRITAKEKAEQDKIEAKNKAEEEKQQAIDDEKIKARAEADRIEKERLEKERIEQDRVRAEKKEQERKSADLEHRGKINRKALSDLVVVLKKFDSEPDVETIGREIIKAIAKKEVSHITVNY